MLDGKVLEDAPNGKKRVIVLGGGYAGTTCAGILDKNPLLQVVLVDKREGQIHKIGGLRAAVKESWVDGVVVPRDKLLKNGKIINRGIQNVTTETVTLEDGTELKYDFLVCATGAMNNSPGEPQDGYRTIEAMKKFYKDQIKLFKGKKKVAIIGGGVVGVEFAGEVNHFFPDAEVTLIHSSETLINSAKPSGVSPGLQKKLKKNMKKKGIKTVLGEKVNIDFAEFDGKSYIEGKKTLTTDKGTKIECDIVFKCVGVTLNTQIYPQAWLADNKQIKVNSFLQVEGTTNCFAIGDIAGTGENGLAYLAAKHGTSAAKNINVISKGGKSLSKYKPMTGPFMVVPLGPTGGASHLPFGAVGPWMTKTIKGKSLFLSMSWQMNGLKTPKITNK